MLLQKEPVAAVLDLTNNGSENPKYVEIPSIDAINFEPDDDFTVELWVQPNASTDGDILGKWNGQNGYPFLIQYDGSTGKVVVNQSDGTNTATLTSNSTINDGDYHHIAIVQTNNRLTLYIDAQEDSTISNSSVTGDTDNESPLWLGARGDENDNSFSNFFDGTLDDVRIWNVARTQEQIEANRIALKNTEETQTNLVGFYTFSDNTARDASSSNNTGTLGGNATVLRSTPDNPLTIPVEADWVLKTGSDNNLVFDLGETEVSTSSNSLTTGDWYYVVATVDTTLNGTATNPEITLYFNDEQVDQTQGAVNFPTNSIITAGQGLDGNLDEIAIYNKVLGIQTEDDIQTDSDGNITNYTTSPTSAGAITSHYEARSNPTENIVGDGTFYAILEDDKWSEANLFQPQQKLFPTTPLLERAPTYDVVSTTALEPDTVKDLYTSISLSYPTETIQAIQVTSPDSKTTWSTTWKTDTDSTLPLAIVQGGLLINNDSGVNHVLLGASETFDLYFQGTSQSGNYTVKVVLSDSTTVPPQDLPLLPNPGTSGTVGDVISAQGDILEEEVSSLAQIDSGLTLDTSEDFVGTAMAAGNFLNGETAIAVAAPFSNSGDGAVLILSAGEDLKADNESLTLDPSEVPSGGKGVLIKGLEGHQEQLGFALAVGDVNGNGADLVIGAPAADDGAGKGKVYVIFGEKLTAGETVDLSTLSSSGKGAMISGFGTDGEGGYSLAVGKLDGSSDQYADIVIGAPFAQQEAGEVYVVKGSSSFSDTSNPTVLFPGKQAGSQAGFSVDIIPVNSGKSLNNDAFADVVIGAPRYSQTVTFNDDFQNNQAATDDADAIAALSAVTPVIPDTNNITGSDDIKLVTGRAYALVSNGSAVTSNSSEVILDGSPIFNSDAEAGYSVSGAGDINSDGFEDLVIGAPEDGKGSGITYVVAGRDSFSDYTNGTPLQLAWESNLIVTGPEAHSQSGSVVFDAGDFNGDQASDLVIGSPQAGYSAGQAHVLFGNTSDSNNPLWSDDYSTAFSLAPGTSQSIAFFNQSGSSIPNPSISTFVLNGTNPQDAMVPSRSALDVNGDGVDDLLASAQIGNQVGILFGHTWLADEGSLKMKALKSDQGFIIDKNPLTKAVQLNGSTDFVEVTSYKGVTGVDPRTVEAWIKVPETATGIQPIISWGKDNVDGEAWRVRLDSGKLRLEVEEGNIVGSTNLLDNQWHHVAVVWESAFGGVANAKLYVDGELEKISSSSPEIVKTASDNDVSIGFQGNKYFEGEIDEVRIWNEARTETQIQANSFISLNSKPETLEAYFTFDDGTASDSSDKGRNGTLEAGASIVDVSDRPIRVTNQVVKLLGDLNQDGYAETLITEGTNSSTLVFGASTQELLDGGLATLELTLTHDSPPEYAAVGDVNGDGFQDVAAVLTGSSPELTLLLGSAELATQATQSLAELPTKAISGTVEAIIPALDINGDGLNDWIVQTSSALSLYLGQEDGSIPTPTTLDLSQTSLSLSSLSLTAINDANRDGISDLVAVDDKAVPVLLLGASDLGSGSNTPAAQSLSEIPTGLSPAIGFNIANAGDFNGDGLGDFAISRVQTQSVVLAVSESGNDSPTYQYLNFVEDRINSLGLVGEATNTFIPNNEAINFSTNQDFTVEAWISPTKGLNNFSVNSVIAKWDGKGSNPYPFAIRYNSSSETITAARFDKSKNPRVTSKTALKPGTWHHVAFVNENKTLKLYINGELESQITDTTTDSTQNNNQVYLGSEGNTKDFFSGSVREIRFWNTARSQESIQANRFIEIDSPSTQANLVGYYPSPLNPDDAAASFPDMSSTENNAVLGDALVTSDTGYQTMQVTTGGDINGDGLDDLVIGAPYISTSTGTDGGGGTNSGETFLVFGNSQVDGGTFPLTELGPKSTNPNTPQGLHIKGLPTSQAGTSVSGDEDINGDGLADFAVGAPTVDNLSYVLFGGDFTASLTQVGTLGNDVLDGTATGDAMIGNSGTDFLLGNGGIDVLSGGAGNDVFTIADTNLRHIDGGSGLDVVKLEGELDQSWNIVELALGGRLRNLEVIDITGYGNNDLLIDSTTVLNLSSTSNTVFIDADVGANDETDTIFISDDFTSQGTVSANGVAYDKYTLGNATLFVTPGIDVNKVPVFFTLTVEDPDDVVDGNNNLPNSLASSDNTVAAFDLTPRVFVSETIVSEADGEAHFTVVRTGDATESLTLNYTTHDGTADAGVDFTTRTGKIVFAPDEQTTTVIIPLTQDESLRHSIRTLELRITEDFALNDNFRQPIIAGR